MYSMFHDRFIVHYASPVYHYIISSFIIAYCRSTLLTVGLKRNCERSSEAGYLRASIDAGWTQQSLQGGQARESLPQKNIYARLRREQVARAKKIAAHSSGSFCQGLFFTGRGEVSYNVYQGFKCVELWIQHTLNDQQGRSLINKSFESIYYMLG